MPPVMGAAAFLMAENLGIPFGQIIKAAVIPALLYFAGIYIVTDLEAKKLGLTGLPKESLPKFKKVMLEKGFLILPLMVIIALLVLGYTASFAALVGIVVAILGSYIPSFIKFVNYTIGRGNESAGEIIKNTSGLHGKDYISALEGGARSIISVALACGVAGIIVGMITKTGIGLKLGAGLTTIANGNLILLLMLTMLASILLGMGVPTTPNYLITSTIMAPSSIKRWLDSFQKYIMAFLRLGKGMRFCLRICLHSILVSLLISLRRVHSQQWLELL